jgi:hypothetical protein
MIIAKAQKKSFPNTQMKIIHSSSNAAVKYIRHGNPQPTLISPVSFRLHDFVAIEYAHHLQTYATFYCMDGGTFLGLSLFQKPARPYGHTAGRRNTSATSSPLI